MPATLRKLIKRSVRCDKALHALEQALFRDPMLKSVVGTTQAIDLIQGGVKTNALPERAWAVVNHRIATERSATSQHQIRCVDPTRLAPWRQCKHTIRSS